MNTALDCTHLQVIADLTAKLTEMRLRNCGHLCIENLGPEIFGKLLDVYRNGGLIIRGEPVNVDELLRNG
jgi:hypothetical protein